MKPAPAGYLAHSSPNLKQSEQVRKNLSKSMKKVFAVKKLPPVKLDWRKK